MRIFFAYFFLVIAISECVEEVPRASPMRATQENEVRRAPVYKEKSTAPRAKGIKRVSTGVRRAPNTSVKPAAHSPKMPHPLYGSVIPLHSMLPMNLPALATVAFPPPMATFPTLPTFSTIAMPTLPTMTMPPSFQRLLGINTTPLPRRTKKHREEDDEEEGERPRRRLQQNKKTERRSVDTLSSVSSRLPKFVNSQQSSALAPDQKADWIVPFKF